MGGVSSSGSHRAGLRRRGSRSRAGADAARWRSSGGPRGQAIVKGGGVHPGRGRGQAVGAIGKQVVAVVQGCCGRWGETADRKLVSLSCFWGTDRPPSRRSSTNGHPDHALKAWSPEEHSTHRQQHTGLERWKLLGPLPPQAGLPWQRRPSVPVWLSVPELPAGGLDPSPSGAAEEQRVTAFWGTHTLVCVCGCACALGYLDQLLQPGALLGGE